MIPDEVIDRKKQGFAAPIPEWFKGELGKEARRQLKEFSDATGLLDWVAVDVLLTSEKRELAWHLLNAAMWWKTYIKTPTS